MELLVLDSNDKELFTSVETRAILICRNKVTYKLISYIQQLCEDTGCNPEDLPEAMSDREKWRERVRDIRAGGTTWWWWWHMINIYLNECTQITDGKGGVIVA